MARGRLILLVLGLWDWGARGAENIESAVAGADWVVRGKIRQLRGNEMLVMIPRGEVLALDVAEDFKGEAGARIFLVVENGLPPLVGKEVLACFGVGGSVRGQPVAIARDALALFELKKGMDPVYSASGERVTDPDRLLVLARAAAQGSRGPARAVVPGAGAQNLLGLALGRRAPPARLTEEEARRWAAKEGPMDRRFGAEALASFRNAENEGILRGLLRDPFYTLTLSRRWESQLGLRVWRVYPVRAAAHGSLWGWQVHVKDESMLPHAAYEALPWGSVGAVGVLVAGVVGWGGLRARRGVRAPWAGRLIGVLAGALGGICVVLLVLQYRSYRWHETFNFAWRGTDFEVTSAAGRVSVLSVEDGAPTRGVTRWKARPGEVESAGMPWYERMLSREKDGRWGGVDWARGRVVGVTRFHEYSMVRWPHWVVWGAVGAWPAWWGVSQAWRGVRRWRWGRAGCCLECGYDLRGRVGARCSECGAVVRTLIVRGNQSERSGLRPESDSAGVGVGVGEGVSRG